MIKSHHALAAAALALSAFAASAAPAYSVTEAILPGGLGTLQAARSAWAATLGGPLQTEGFEGLAAAPASGFDFGPFTLTTSAPLVLFGNNSLVRTEGVQGLGFSGNGTMTFTFDTALTAFAIDWSSFDSLNTVISYQDNAGGSVADIFQPLTSAGAGFFGVVNGAGFTQVTFTAQSGEILEFDNIQFLANNVPEPSSLALVALALAGCGAWRRRTAG